MIIDRIKRFFIKEIEEEWEEVKGPMKDVLLYLIKHKKARSFGQIANAINKYKMSVKVQMDKLISKGIVNRIDDNYVLDKERVLVIKETKELREIAFFLSAGLLIAIFLDILTKSNLLAGALIVYTTTLLYYIYKYLISQDVRIYIKPKSNINIQQQNNYEKPTNI